MGVTEEIKGFVRQVAIVLIVGVVVGGYPVYASLGYDSVIAALVGCGISTANVIAGVVTIVWAFDKPQSVFLKAILGGIAARMAAIFIALILFVRLTSLEIFPLVGSLFVFYLVFQALELRFVVRRGQESKEA